MTRCSSLRIWIVVLALGCACFAPPSGAQPALSARNWILVDAASGATLNSNNAAARVEPASLTKLMTAYVVFSALAEKQIALEDNVNVTREAFLAPGKNGARMYIEPGKPVRVDELINGLIVVSANDAAVALAEHVSGSVAAFVARMNAEAVRIGMVNTHFANPGGLGDPQNYSSAEDIARLSMRLYEDYPREMRVFAAREASYAKVTQANRNRLLWADPFVDGLKTGYLETAGWCIAASAARPQGVGPTAFNRRLVAVVLGAASESLRAQEALQLLNYGFANFETLRLYRKRQQIAEPQVWQGDRDTVPLGFAADVYITVPRDELMRLGEKSIKPSLERPDPLLAPIRQGAPVGRVKVSIGTRVITSVPVIALEPVESAGLMGRAYDAVRLWMRK